MFLSWAHVFPKLFLLCLSFNLSKFLPSIVFFLVVDTQLYKRLCPSIHLSVRWSVGPPARVEKWENKRSRTFLVANSCISAPAHLSATDGRVSGLVLFLFLLLPLLCYIQQSPITLFCEGLKLVTKLIHQISPANCEMFEKSHKVA